MATIIEELRQSVQLERPVIARLKTANIRFTDAQVERIWAIVSAHQAGLSIRKIAGATGLSSSRIHQLLNAPEGKEIPVWLSQLRQSSRGSGGTKKRPESETEIRSGLAREVEMLRRCIDWLQRLERGENVVVNLRLDEEFRGRNVAFDASPKPALPADLHFRRRSAMAVSLSAGMSAGCQGMWRAVAISHAAKSETR